MHFHYGYLMAFNWYYMELGEDEVTLTQPFAL